MQSATTITLGYIVLIYSPLNFVKYQFLGQNRVHSVTLKPFKITSWNFIHVERTYRWCAECKNHNSCLCIFNFAPIKWRNVYLTYLNCPTIIKCWNLVVMNCPVTFLGRVKKSFRQWLHRTHPSWLIISNEWTTRLKRATWEYGWLLSTWDSVSHIGKVV